MQRRNTKYKQAILKVFERNHLLSAKELQEMIDGADPSTIYRNLKRLESDGVLRGVQIDTVTKYELIDKHGEHDHFVCKSCQAVKTIFVAEAAIRPQLPSDDDFSITIHGLCGECKQHNHDN